MSFKSRLLNFLIQLTCRHPFWSPLYLQKSSYPNISFVLECEVCTKCGKAQKITKKQIKRFIK
jgi:hypothetical protein